MKRKSILLVLCIGMVLTSCKNIKTLNDSDVKNEKSQKKTVMEIQDKGYDLPIDEKKKKEVVNDCEENRNRACGKADHAQAALPRSQDRAYRRCGTL